MKKLLCVILIILSFSACSVEVKEPSLHIYNAVNDYEACLKVDSELIQPVSGSLLISRTNGSIEEIKEMLLEKNSNIEIIDLNSAEFLVKYNDMILNVDMCPYILFTKNVVDKDNNPIDDVVAITSTSESFYTTSWQTEDDSYKQYSSPVSFWYPIHLIKHYYTCEFNGNESYCVSPHYVNPFDNEVPLLSNVTAFTDLVDFYKDCGYSVDYEGGDLTGGAIIVQSCDTDETMFRIQVKHHNDEWFMKYEQGSSLFSESSKSVIYKYINALQSHDLDSYISCFYDEPTNDEEAEKSYLDSIEKCILQSIETYRADNKVKKYTYKVTYDITYSPNLIPVGGQKQGEQTEEKFISVDYNNGEPLITEVLAYYTGDTNN